MIMKAAFLCGWLSAGFLFPSFVSVYMLLSRSLVLHYMFCMEYSYETTDIIFGMYEGQVVVAKVTAGSIQTHLRIRGEKIKEQDKE